MLAHREHDSYIQMWFKGSLQKGIDMETSLSLMRVLYIYIILVCIFTMKSRGRVADL